MVIEPKHDGEFTNLVFRVFWYSVTLRELELAEDRVCFIL